MKKLFFSILLICTGFASNAQDLFNGFATITSSTLISDSTYYVTLSAFTGGYRPYPDANYEVTDIPIEPTGYVMWASCVRFVIDSVTATIPLTLRVTDTRNSGGLNGLDLLGYRVGIGQEGEDGITFNVADGNAGSFAGISPYDFACIRNYYNGLVSENGVFYPDTTVFALDTITHGQRVWNEQFDVKNGYLYYSPYNSDSFHIYNVTDPANVELISSTLLFPSTGAVGPTVFCEGIYCYRSTNVNDTLYIIDVSNPVNPAIVSKLNTGAGADIVTHKHENYLFTTDFSLTMKVIDVSNPLIPVLSDVKVFDYGGAQAFTSQSFVLKDSILFIGATDQGGIISYKFKEGKFIDSLGFSQCFASLGGAFSFDIHDNYGYASDGDSLAILKLYGDSISIINTIKFPYSALISSPAIKNVRISGDFLLISNAGASSGLMVYNIKNPYSPQFYSLIDINVGTGFRPFRLWKNYLFAGGRTNNSIITYDIGGISSENATIGRINSNEIYVDKLVVNEFIYGDKEPDVNHGNILYVATTGDNATAVKGNPHKPWADPQTAIDAAIDGDIVHLFPGVYNYGSSGFAITNLAKKNVTFYMASGVTLFNTDAVPQTLFNMTDAGSYKILGGGSIVTGNGDNPFVLNNENLTCVIELINYTHTGGTANTSYFTQFYAAKSLNCSIKNYNSDNSRQYLAYLGSQYSLFDTVSQINIDIENVEFNMKNAPTSGSGRDFIYVGACNNTQFNLSIKNINYRGAGGNGFMWLQNTFGFRKGVINIDVQNGRFYVSSATKTNQGVINLNDDQAAIDSLSILNFACKNCESEVPILFHKGTLNSDTTVVYGLNGKFRMLGNIPAISGNINTHRSTILMNCDVIGKNANVINLTSSADYFITGKYSNSGANPIVNYNSSTSKVILRNTIAINDGTTAPIQATSVVNITTYNSYTNSTGTDPDVTHRVTSLVYDPFVK